MEQQAKYAVEHTRIHPDAERVSRPNPAAPFADNRPRTASLRKLAEAMDESPRVVAQRKLAEAMDNSPRIATQRKLAEAMNDSPRMAAQRKLPEQSLSGISPEKAGVHSALMRPAPLNALARAQGSDIHVIPGQEQQLHQAWHLVQPGRVKPTLQLKGIPFGPRIVQRSFQVGTSSFPNPGNYSFTLASALNATEPIPRGEAKEQTGRSAGSGVNVGEVGSYQYIQYLETTGDQLTGDHQPSGAAIKEAIREQLHTALNKPLTRSMAKNAYGKAVTVVMTDVWHKLKSRTYGGRNTPAQIKQDANDLAAAAIEDWKRTVAGLEQEGLTAQEIQDIWTDLDGARQDFFATGNAQVGSL